MRVNRFKSGLVQDRHETGLDIRRPEGLPPVLSFQDVVIGPVADRQQPGAAWADFEQQTHARLYRRGGRVCKPPAFKKRPETVVQEPVIFASCYDNHFGHLTAETVPRLPQALAEHNDLPIVFTRMTNDTSHAPSAMFCSVMEWLRIPLEQIRFIDQPTLFRQVYVAAQGEHLDGPPTPPEYVDLLEKRIAPNLQLRAPEGVAFVTRCGLDHKMGYHAAERYLVALLRDLGVRIIYPENLTLPEQMRLYAQARFLVFSEGSALHGRQLLGRVEQDIAVLRRRKLSEMAKGQIEARCSSLTYVPCFGGALHVTNKYGVKVTYAMKSFYNIEAILSFFDSLGVPLRQRWDMARYRDARDQDVLNWVFTLYDAKIEHWLKPANEDDYLLDQFERLHLKHLREQASALIKARKLAW